MLSNGIETVAVSLFIQKNLKIKSALEVGGNSTPVYETNRIFSRSASMQTFDDDIILKFSKQTKEMEKNYYFLAQNVVDIIIIAIMDLFSCINNMNN